MTPVQNKILNSVGSRLIYLDNQATTPVDPRVLDAMLPYFTEQFGNPHSRNHKFGWDAEAADEKARGQISQLIGANPKEVIFTSGATESNNIAISGIPKFYQERNGYSVTYLPVKEDGIVDVDLFKESITDNTLFASVMFVNNEIGSIQPIKELASISRENGVFFHTDAAQALGKIPVDVEDLGVDLMSLSSHKIYGPMGIGSLYVRRRPRVRLRPLFHGGGQERGFRSGTVPTPLCVGFGEACEIAEREMDRDMVHVSQLRKVLDESLMKEDLVYMNGSSDGPEFQYPGCANYSFGCVEGESLLMAIKSIAVSSGSACTSASLEPSYVLKATGLGDLAHTSIRYGLGRFSTKQEVEMAAIQTLDAVKRLRELSPLWELHLEGVDINAIEWEQDHL